MTTLETKVLSLPKTEIL